MFTDEQISRLLDIANAGCHKGAVLEARTIYDGVLAVKPGHVPALIGRALSHIVIGEYDEGEAQLRAVLETNPDDDDATVLMGLCLTLAGKKDDARPFLEKAKKACGASAVLAASLLEQVS
ncbi:MAG: tetratricopeptide repeat protein [Desulfovibrionaceae bacterium]|nr:tetratricopeptide repeat protein [Desulfovibrionaceae bacterium]